jgi:hypothetical protein
VIVKASSELPEVSALSHRILVTHEGRTVKESVNGGHDEQTIVAKFGAAVHARWQCIAAGALIAMAYVEVVGGRINVTR